ncbi:MAG: hypothetical protein AAGI23_12640 [Bacteroidota bacterium]
MRRNFTLLLVAIGLPFFGFSQNFKQLSLGEGYGQHIFYDLDTETSVVVENDAWDLAFTTIGFQDAGVHFNEASSNTFTAPKPSLEVYLADAANFNALTEFDTTFKRLYNDEESWIYGAFNVDRTANTLDYGWGTYDPTIRRVVGDELFIIKLRSGNFIKFELVSLDLTTYNIRYANLDGSNLKTFSFDKNSVDGSLAFFSFATNDLVDLDIEGFDLLYTRYNSPAEHPDDSILDSLDYDVTGFLSGLGVSIAEVSGKKPEEVTDADAANTSTRLDVIGYDWKRFDFNDGWVMPDDLSYVVRSNEGKLYHLVFIDFEGITTGTTTFSAETFVSASTTPTLAPHAVKILGQPTDRQLNMTVQWQQTTAVAQFHLYDANGRRLWATDTRITSGEQQLNFELPTLPSAIYYLRAQIGGLYRTFPVVIAQ